MKNGGAGSEEGAERKMERGAVSMILHSFGKRNFTKKRLFFNLAHPNERNSKWVGAYSWMVKHLPPLILT